MINIAEVLDLAIDEIVGRKYIFKYFNMITKIINLLLFNLLSLIIKDILLKPYSA